MLRAKIGRKSAVGSVSADFLCRRGHFHQSFLHEYLIVIVPELFLVLFRPGTMSVRSGLGTFFIPEPEHAIRRTVQKVGVWPMGEGGE